MKSRKKKIVTRGVNENEDEEDFLKFLAEIIVEIIIKQTSTPKNKKSCNQ